MNNLIKSEPNKLYISEKLLGTSEAEIWVAPKNESKLTWQWWIEFKRRWWQFLRTTGIYWNPYSFALETLSLNNGYYELDVSKWRANKQYRLNLHTKKGERSPFGNPFRQGVPDAGQYSWAKLDPELQPELVNWLFVSPSGRGYAISIKISPEREIISAGNLN